MNKQTEKLREKIAREFFFYHGTHTWEEALQVTDQILTVSKEVGLKFVTSFVGTDYKDGVPTVAREIKEIEM